LVSLLAYHCGRVERNHAVERGGLPFLTAALTMPEIDVRNLPVLVTAGGSGICRTIAESLAVYGAIIVGGDIDYL
jgi:hypothetical protein